jgi:spore germination protein YaaH
MNEQGPFDRILDRDRDGQVDKSAQMIFIAMGLVGLVILLFVVNPFSIFGGDDGNGGGNGGTTNGGGLVSTNAPRVPDGYVALSDLVEDLRSPENTNPPYQLTVSLSAPVSDGRNLGLYTYKDNKWERVGSAALGANGRDAIGEVADMPENVAVLRQTSSAVQVSGYLAANAGPDPDALNAIATLNPVDFAPAANGSLTGQASDLPSVAGNVLPTVRASTPEQDEAVNQILASPALRDEHITALVQLALAQGNAGVDLDYARINPARRADFTAFISQLADQLHQANRTLTLKLPTPTKSGVNWETGAYDWQQIASKADLLKLTAVEDPSIYFTRMTEVLEYLKTRVDLKKVSLVVSRNSHEKATDGLRTMSLHEGLSLASQIEIRTQTAVLPDSAVVIVGTNIFQDDGASGLKWDDTAAAVSFEYPGRGGVRTVWLENSLSLAFKLDLARRYNLGGIAVDDVSSSPVAPALWAPLRTYSESGNVSLVQPNGVLLRPQWEIQAGNIQGENRGTLTWKAPPQPGAYDISLIVSDGVIRAASKIVLQVQAPAP